MSRSRRLALLTALVLLAGLLPGGVAAVDFAPGAPGIGDPYFPLDGNGGYDVDHYLLEVRYDPDTDVLEGVASIEARATQNLSSFNLDFVGLTVRSITVGARPASWTRDGGELTVTPARGIAAGSTFKVVVVYDGIPETLSEFGVSGFIHTDDGALIAGEPHVAATWYPVNDHPSDKASYTFRVTVPEGLEAVANGVLESQRTRGGWTTWTWQAKEPMASYLTTATIGEFELNAYQVGGIRYWDAIDPALLEVPPPPPTITPTDGTQMLFSQRADSSYKRLTRVIDVPPGGATLTFDTFHDTEGGWDFLFVEARTPGEDDWTTLPEATGLTSNDIGGCPFNSDEDLGDFDAHPFFSHYLTPVLVDAGDPDDPFDDFWSCDPVGTTGTWSAMSGEGFDWETWRFDLPNATAGAVQLEISIAYASNEFFQARGVTLDNVVVSTGEGTTSFENDGDPLDGWVATDAPAGSEPNPNTWTVATVLEPLAHVIEPTDGSQMLFSQVGEPAYKRLTRVIDVPPGGATLTFDTFHDTEGGWDFLFVEARTPGEDDWTTFPEATGLTSSAVGACPFDDDGVPGNGFDAHPFFSHYLTPVLVDAGDPDDPFDDFWSCDPVGTTGTWSAMSGEGFDWETWQVDLPNGGPTAIAREVSITYESDRIIQFRGVTLDNIVVSTGEGTTSFEDDGDPLDGWVATEAPAGSEPNPNTWTTVTVLEPPPPPPPLGVVAQASFARQPEIIGFLADVFGRYPFTAGGGIVDNVGLGFALENQTRPIYSPFFFFDQLSGDNVVVHELAHQWAGDSFAVERWQHIWLNEGFASYTEWLWSAREGLGTEQEIFDFWYHEIFPEGDSFWDLEIGDPGPDRLFDFAVYIRGAMTLHQLRVTVGDADFFRILRQWAQRQSGGTVTTDEFIALAEQVSGEDLDELFEAWLFTPGRPALSGAAAAASAGRSSSNGAKVSSFAATQLRAMLASGGRGSRLDGRLLRELRSMPTALRANVGKR